MQTVQSDLTIFGAHTTAPMVYWKGSQVSPVTALKVVNGVVTLTVPEDPVLAEMVAAGFKIVRA